MYELLVVIALIPIVPHIAWMFLVLIGLLTKRQGARQVSLPVHFTIVVPAHNEQDSIGKTIDSLKKLDYPQEQYEIIVIADNCSDQTAELARQEGVGVWERQSPEKESKGNALEECFKLLMKNSDTEAVVVIDADTRVHPNLLLEFAVDIGDGKDWIQGLHTGHNAYRSWRSKLRQWGFGLFNGVYLAGIQGLGLSVPLRGNGMCFSRKGLERVPWKTHGRVNDMEFGWKLRLHGERIHFNPEARVKGVLASKSSNGYRFQPWQDSKRVIRKTIRPQLTQLPFLARVLAYVELSLWPLGKLVSYLLCIFAFAMGLLIASDFHQLSVMLPFFIPFAVIFAYTMSPFIMGFARVRVLSAVIYVPFYLLSKISAVLLPRSKKSKPDDSQKARSASKFDFGGISFDRLTTAQVVERTIALSQDRKVSWVVTPNSDFLRRMRRDSSLKKIIGKSSIVIADGMLVGWAARLLGDPLPSRLALANLLPRICRQAAKHGIKVCFLGKSKVETEAAISQLKKIYPGFEGVAIELPDDEDQEKSINNKVIDDIRESESRIVFVGARSPSQEKWIFEHRHALPRGVYLGIGQSASILTGNKRQSPQLIRICIAHLAIIGIFLRELFAKRQS